MSEQRTRATKPVQQRFWSKVDRSGKCWLWTASTRSNGYGNFYFRGRCTNAHRVAWTLTHGEIPEGKQVLHNCSDGDNPLCVNPAHLFLGTIQDNVRDMYAKGRSWFDQKPEEARAVLSACRPHRQVRGEEVGTAKLMEVDVWEILAGFFGGETKAALARRYGISRMQVYSIVTGRKWAHVMAMWRALA